MSATQKQSDVTIYWTSLGGTREDIKKIRELGEAAIPPLVDWAERQSFTQNLTFIQSLLSHELTAAGTAA